MIPVRFYRTEAGGAPVLDWLRGFDKEPARHRTRPYASAVRLADWEATGAKPKRWSLGSALVASSQRIARLILCFHDEVLVVLHGFIKKTQKTPTDHLALAKRRMKEVTK